MSCLLFMLSAHLQILAACNHQVGRWKFTRFIFMSCRFTFMPSRLRQRKFVLQRKTPLSYLENCIFYDDWTVYFFIFMFSIILSLCFLWDLLQKIWWALELQSCILSENWAKRSFIFEEKLKNIKDTWKKYYFKS